MDTERKKVIDAYAYMYVRKRVEKKMSIRRFQIMAVISTLTTVYGALVGVPRPAVILAGVCTIIMIVCLRVFDHIVHAKTVFVVNELSDKDKEMHYILNKAERFAKRRKK